MTVIRRRLFWKIYTTLLVSLVATSVFMSTLFWFLGETQREGLSRGREDRYIARLMAENVSLYAADGTLISARGAPITPKEFETHLWGPHHVARIDLPDGRFVLTRLGPSRRVRALWLLTMMIVVVAAVGLAAYPVTALITRRLERLRVGVAGWGDVATPIRLDERGSDEVALLARTFNEAAARIDALLTSQKALLANASHELRSPLARLRLAVEMGAQAADPFRGEAIRNLTEMDQLVDELLLSSRLDHPDLSRDRWETVDLLGLCAEEASRYEINVTGDPVEIGGDRVLLRRMVRNLIENAVRHGRPPVTVHVARDANGAIIEVGDAGAGIAAPDRERIFEPFYRPSGAPEAAGGWGLGLALVRQIAERHGGRVECHDRLSGGSVFVAYLANRQKPAEATG